MVLWGVNFVGHGYQGIIREAGRFWPVVNSRDLWGTVP